MSDSPLLLAVETATARASVALMHGEHVLARRAGHSGQHHSETLLPMIDAVLGEQDAAPDDVEAFAVSIGPGAFTSLRIGLATVKGLAFGTERPVVSVSSLEALALAAATDLPSSDAVWAATLDARRGDVYAAAYRGAALVPHVAPAAERGPVIAPGIFTPEALAEALPEGARVVGEGAAVLSRSPHWPEALALQGAPHSVPDAVAVGRLGLRGLADGEGRPAAELEPVYLRPAQAEEVRAARAARAGASLDTPSKLH